MPQAQTTSPFLSHLIELRSRLLRIFMVVGVLFLCLLYWARELYTWLSGPLMAALPPGAHMIATEVTTPFLIPAKVALATAFLLGLPYVLYQIWAFIAPGLYTHEKRWALPLIVASTVLFFIGMAFAYFVVFPTAFKFFAGYAPTGVAMMTDIEKYWSFVLNTLLAFGITFEVPILVIVLVRFGLISLDKLRNIRRYVIVIAFIVAAIFTPPDVLSQLMLAIPLCLLYEFGLLLARLFIPSTKIEERKTPSP